MRILLTLIVSVAFSLTFPTSADAQDKGNVVLFTENGERFYVILNGLRKNQDPETQVKLVGLNHPRYRLKVIFKDSTIPDLDANLYTKPGRELTYAIISKSAAMTTPGLIAIEVRFDLS